MPGTARTPAHARWPDRATSGSYCGRNGSVGQGAPQSLVRDAHDAADARIPASQSVVRSPLSVVKTAPNVAACLLRAFRTTGALVPIACYDPSSVGESGARMHPGLARQVASLPEPANAPVAPVELEHGPDLSGVR
jgi:hypothetical protein